MRYNNNNKLTEPHIVLAFPKPEYYRNLIDNYIYNKDNKKIEINPDLPDSVGVLEKESQLNEMEKSDTEYIYLAYNYM